jgi:CBS domain-containing protein
MAGASSGEPLPALSEVYVSEVMHRGVFRCSADTPLTEVARLMSRERIHAVVVTGIRAEDSSRDRHPWGIVSDLDLVAAALAKASDATAGKIAAMEFLTVGAGHTLEQAAQLMTEHGVNHLVVLDLQTGRAVGVLSTHDVAKLIGSEERP